MSYDYKQCTEEMRAFCANVPEAEMFCIGESVMEQKIYCIKYGTGDKKLLLNGAHHGLEYITSAFLMRFLRSYADSVHSCCDMLGFDAHGFFEKVSLYAVPMVNPDGVDIAINGLDITNRHHRRLISLVGIHSFNKVWQANANGVDINHNYDARWSVVEKNPSPTRYSGPYAESEPETRCITSLVRSERFDMLIAFHSQGGEIYYDFDGLATEKDARLAQRMSEESGYFACAPKGSAEFGGCKDWFIKEFGKSGFTVEMGHGKNPLPEEGLNRYYDENARIVLCALAELSGF